MFAIPTTIHLLAAFITSPATRLLLWRQDRVNFYYPATPLSVMQPLTPPNKNPNHVQHMQRMIRTVGWQTGASIDPTADSKRHAINPGMRISKNGKPYFEGRANRSDRPGTNQ